MAESESRSHHSSRKRDRRSISPESRSSRSSSSHHRSHKRDESDRHRSSSKHSHHHKKRRRSPSTDSSSSDSSSSSATSSDEEEERRRRHHKKSKKEKEKKHKKSKSKKKSKKHKKSKLGAVGDQWGKYGIIHEADIFTKEAEFQAWLIEVKKENVETLNNVKRKKMFIDFMEDYNTATMPHEKYYNLEQWEKRDRALRMGEQLPTTSSAFDFRNDEERLRMEHKRAANMAQASKIPQLQLSRDQLEELTKVNRERVELDRMRKMGLKTKSNLGVRYD